MLSKDAKITVIGAGVIGGITAAFIKKAGWDPLLVCKHTQTAALSMAPGMQITGVMEIENGQKPMSLDNLAELAGKRWGTDDV